MFAFRYRIIFLHLLLWLVTKSSDRQGWIIYIYKYIYSSIHQSCIFRLDWLTSLQNLTFKHIYTDNPYTYTYISTFFFKFIRFRFSMCFFFFILHCKRSVFKFVFYYFFFFAFSVFCVKLSCVKIIFDLLSIWWKNRSKKTKSVLFCSWKHSSTNEDESKTQKIVFYLTVMLTVFLHLHLFPFPVPFPVALKYLQNI